MLAERDTEYKDGTQTILEADDLFEVKERNRLHFLDLPTEIHWRFLNFMSDLDAISLTLTWYVITFISHTHIGCFESLCLYPVLFISSLVSYTTHELVISDSLCIPSCITNAQTQPNINHYQVPS